MARKTRVPPLTLPEAQLTEAALELALAFGQKLNPGSAFELAALGSALHKVRRRITEHGEIPSSLRKVPPAPPKALGAKEAREAFGDLVGEGS